MIRDSVHNASRALIYERSLRVLSTQCSGHEWAALREAHEKQTQKANLSARLVRRTKENERVCEACYVKGETMFSRRHTMDSPLHYGGKLHAKACVNIVRLEVEVFFVVVVMRARETHGVRETRWLRTLRIRFLSHRIV